MKMASNASYLKSENSSSNTDMPSDEEVKTVTIHSGQFMKSEVHNGDSSSDDEEEVELQGLSPGPVQILSPVNSPPSFAPCDSKLGGFDFMKYQPPVKNFEFGHRRTSSLAIDASLTRLFQCMTLAYNGGKLISPKWKAFKGMKLSLKDKIRLNNIIWREWHMQFIQYRNPLVCQFATPLSDDNTHLRAEAVVLEGKYWKRRLETVAAEYQKWRSFNKHRDKRSLSENNLFTQTSDNQLLDGLPYSDKLHSRSHSPSPLALGNFDDDFLMELSDTLFSSLNQPFAFPNPKEMSQLGNADFIQPGLVQLQPNFEELMDTMPPLQDYFSNYSLQMNNNQPSVAAYSNSNQQQNQNQQFSNALNTDFQTQLNRTFNDTSQLSSFNTGGISNASLLNRPLVNKLVSVPNVPNVPYTKHQNLLVQNDLNVCNSQQEQPQAQAQARQIAQEQSLFRPGAGLSINSGVLINESNLRTLQNVQSMPNMQTNPSDLQPVQTVQSLPDLQALQNVQKSTTSVTQSAAKDFAVPKTRQKVKNSPARRVRPIYPAPTKPTAVPTVMPLVANSSDNPPLNHDNNYLAKLLTQPNLEKEIKREETFPLSVSNIQSTSVPLVLSQPQDFPTSIMMAAVKSVSHVSTLQSDMVVNISNALSMSPAGIVTSIPTSTVVLSSPASPEYPVSPSSSKPSVRPKTEYEKPEKHSEHRRACHISAEQRRRCSIKYGFDTLSVLIPAIQSSPNAKISKAAMLQKTAEYCQKLKEERATMSTEASILRQEIEGLNAAINSCQTLLPATGAPVTRQRADEMKHMLKQYVRTRTLQNWKFWIFSQIFQDLFDSYNNMVSTSSMDELCRTVLTWLDQHCSLPTLRPAVLSSLTKLSTSTAILSDPSRMKEQATAAVTENNNGT